MSEGLNENASYTLTCRLEGKPFPNVTWLKNGQPFNVHSGSPKKIVGPVGGVTNVTFSLKFEKINRADEGNYSCKANNSINEAISSLAVIVVQCEYMITNVDT